MLARQEEATWSNSTSGAHNPLAPKWDPRRRRRARARARAAPAAAWRRDGTPQPQPMSQQKPPRATAGAHSAAMHCLCRACEVYAPPAFVPGAPLDAFGTPTALRWRAPLATPRRARPPSASRPLDAPRGPRASGNRQRAPRMKHSGPRPRPGRPAPRPRAGRARRRRAGGRAAVNGRAHARAPRRPHFECRRPRRAGGACACPMLTDWPPAGLSRGRAAASRARPSAPPARRPRRTAGLFLSDPLPLPQPLHPRIPLGAQPDPNARDRGGRARPRCAQTAAGGRASAPLPPHQASRTRPVALQAAGPF
jgi:hypothetical protein